MSGPSNAMHVRGLTRRFGDFVAVNAIDFDVAQGEVFGFLGANGAGKSVLMRLMHGLLPPTSGRISWRSKGPQAMVFQRPVMLRRSALGNVVYALRIAGVGAAERPAMDALKEVGLAHLAHRPARMLSGGGRSDRRPSYIWQTSRAPEGVW